jgi:hypothetical protein
MQTIGAVRCGHGDIVVVQESGKKIMLGSKELICTVTTLLNLFATSIFSAPPRQNFLGSNVLCIPLVHVSQPIARNVWALSHVNVTLGDGLRQSSRQVIELGLASTSKPHE